MDVQMCTCVCVCVCKALTMLLDDGDIDKAFANLGDAQRDVHRLHPQLLLLLVLVLDEEWNVHVHRLHPLLQLHRPRRLWRGEGG